MKRNYNYIMFIGIILIFSALAIKYVTLKEEYRKSERDKIEYCKKYNILKCKFERDSLVANPLK